MHQRIVHGGTIDALTAEECAELLRAEYRGEVEERVRAAATLVLDGTGSGEDDVYSPPLGFEFEARRVSIDIASATDVGTGQVVLGAGKTVEYLRGVGGTRIEWGQPSFGASVQVPGIQTWGDEQGPYIRNGETFAVRAKGLTASVTLDVTVEGILRKPAKDRDHLQPLSSVTNRSRGPSIGGRAPRPDRPNA